MCDDRRLSLLGSGATVALGATIVIALTTSAVAARTHDEPGAGWSSQATTTLGPPPTNVVPRTPTPDPPPRTPGTQPTPRLPGLPTPTPQPAWAPPTVDLRILLKVPRVAVDNALANPGDVRGWGKRLNPSTPYHPLHNPYRTCLTLTNPSVPYRPVFNDLVFKAGCR